MSKGKRTVLEQLARLLKEGGEKAMREAMETLRASARMFRPWGRRKQDGTAGEAEEAEEIVAGGKEEKDKESAEEERKTKKKKKRMRNCRQVSNGKRRMPWGRCRSPQGKKMRQTQPEGNPRQPGRSLRKGAFGQPPARANQCERDSVRPASAMSGCRSSGKSWKRKERRVFSRREGAERGRRERRNRRRGAEE